MEDFRSWPPAPNGVGLTFDDITHLETLDDLLTSDPILHHIITTGPTTPRAIAHKLAWPPQIVLFKLRDYKRDGYVIDSENPKQGQAMVWEATAQFAELYDWVMTRRRDWDENA